MSETTLSPVNLCLASQLFYPYYAGGALRFLRYLPGLKRRHVQARVFTGTPHLNRARSSDADKSWQAYRYGQMLPVETVNDMPVHRVRLPDTSDQRRIIQYSWTLFQFCRQPDYRPDLIQFLPLSPWSIPALLRLRQLNLPMVYAYTLLGKLSFDSPRRLIQHYFRRLQLRLMNCIVVNSRAMHIELRRLGVKTRIEVIPNGVDTERFKPVTTLEAKRAMRQALGLCQDVPLIVSVGSVKPRKGIDLLLAAWANLAPKCAQPHLVIVGPRSDLREPELASFHQDLEDLMMTSGARDRIHFTGRVENVEQYLQAADAFVFTSQREGLPNVVLEAMASGLPVVTTPFTGLSQELGRTDEQYLLAAPDPQAVSHVLERALKEKELRATIGASARAWIEAEMDLERSLDHYAAVYHELASQTGL